MLRGEALRERGGALRELPTVGATNLNTHVDACEDCTYAASLPCHDASKQIHIMLCERPACLPYVLGRVIHRYSHGNTRGPADRFHAASAAAKKPGGKNADRRGRNRLTMLGQSDNKFNPLVLNRCSARVFVSVP